RAAPGVRRAGRAHRAGVGAGQRDRRAGGCGGRGGVGGAGGREGRERHGGAKREQYGGGTGTVHGRSGGVTAESLACAIRAAVATCRQSWARRRAQACRSTRAAAIAAGSRSNSKGKSARPSTAT